MSHKIKGEPSSPLVPVSWGDVGLSAFKSFVDTKEILSIDSSDMNPAYWGLLAEKIGENYDKYDGFVILHGTDTMAYTACALSFMLENLKKPVVITGAQLPIAKQGSDAPQNLAAALAVAAAENIPVIPEVSILFGNLLLRGNRARKMNTSGFSVFDSPNYEPLARIVGEPPGFVLSQITPQRKPTHEPLQITDFRSFETNVLSLDIFPGMSNVMLKNILALEGLKGVVIKTYGAGNAPTVPNFLNEIENAVNKGIVIVNVTQCPYGAVDMGLYGASVGLLQRGVISGLDMSPEAALVKLMFLLGQGYAPESVKEKMQLDLRGEVTNN